MCFLWSPLSALHRLLHRQRRAAATHAVVAHEETLVFFDLETTGLSIYSCDIVQLSATCGRNVYNCYLFPRCPIDPGASRVTGLTTKGRNLFLNGVQVQTNPIPEALTSFISFLQMFKNPILTAHNCKRFDSVILLRILDEFNLLHDFWDVAAGFLDTLLLSREMFKLPKYTQPFLVQHFLHKSYDAHEATADARALQELFRKWRPSAELVKKHTFIP